MSIKTSICQESNAGRTLSLTNGRVRPGAVVATLNIYVIHYSMNSIRSAYDIASDLDLPAEYVQFLATRNGGICRQSHSIRLNNGTEVLCDCLFGFGLQPGIDFQFWQGELADDLPKGSVVIGSDPGGAFFILLNERGAWKLMYYDHAYRLPSSNDEGNTYDCEISLHDFLALVTEDFGAKA